MTKPITPPITLPITKRVSAIVTTVLITLILQIQVLQAQVVTETPLANHTTTPTNITNTRILALGDSYTVGTGVLKMFSWPQQLHQQLHLDTAPLVVAQNGWTTQNLLDGMHRAFTNTPLSEPYDWAFILIGSNNHFQQRSLSEYQQHLTLIVQQAQTRSRHPVTILSLPDWTLSPFAHKRFNQISRQQARERLATYNQIAHQVAIDTNNYWLDLRHLSDAYATSPNGPADGESRVNSQQQNADLQDIYAPDGLHFSKLQNKLWAQHIATHITEQYGSIKKP